MNKSNYPSGLHASAWVILMHYYWSPLDLLILQPDHAYGRAREELIENGLLEYATSDGPGTWQLTARGRVLAQHVAQLPLPVEETNFVMPRP